MREGWACPRCHRVLSPDLHVCPCSPAGPSPAVTAYWRGRGVTVIYRTA